MWRLLLSVLLLATTVGAQDEPIQLFGFRGLNTIAGDFQLKPVDARKAHNIDFGRQIGTLMPRRGYDSISAMSGMDSLVGIFGAYYSDGVQKLFMVADSDGVGYGNVYVSADGSADISSASRIWQYFSIQNKPSFAMLDDNVYMVNGSQRGIVYDGNNARPYPLQAPGEPLIVPLTASGPLHGEYRYMFRARAYYSTFSAGYSNGVVSTPISVKNGQILHTRFQFGPIDSAMTPPPIDSVRIKPYRTKANPGPLDLSDSAYWTGDYWMLKGSNIGDLVFYDSVADSSLSTTDKYTLVEPGAWAGKDSTGGSIGRRYGAPTYISQDTTHPDGDTLLDIFEGWPTPQSDTLGVVYVCTFIDTATGIESDTGRSLFVFCDSGDHSPSYRQVTINLPKTIDTEDGIVVNLYRAGIIQLGHDSNWVDTFYLGSDQPQYGIPMYAFLPETVVVIDYYLVGQFTVDDTIFTDNISFDSLSRQRRYRKETAPPLMSKIFSYENRLFGIQKSGLYYSANVYADTLQSWGAMALTPINPDDGDMVTTAWPARGVIRVMKSYSNINVYQDANLNWSKTEISGYFGCIAGRSRAAGLGGHYYLSSEGVLREVEGMALERTQQVSLLSPTLNNFDQYSVIDLSQAEAFYFDRKYLLNLGDTTYVYDERAETWSTWGFEFSSATLYGTEDEVRFLPGDSMYFIKSGSSGLYRFAGSDSDMTTPIEMAWKSGPFLAGPEEKRIYKVGRWIRSEAEYTIDTILNDTGTFGNKAGIVGTFEYLASTEQFGHWDATYMPTWQSNNVPACTVNTIYFRVGAGPVDSGLIGYNSIGTDHHGRADYFIQLNWLDQFTMVSDGVLGDGKLYTRLYGGPGTVEYKMYVYEIGATDALSPLVASSSTVQSTSETYQWMTIPFPGAITLESGKTYAVAFSQRSVTGGGVTPYFKFDVDVNNTHRVCDNGSFNAPNNLTTFGIIGDQTRYSAYVEYVEVSTAKVRLAVYDCDDADPDNWFVEGETQYGQLPDNYPLGWSSVQCTLDLAAGRKAVAIIGYDGTPTDSIKVAYTTKASGPAIISTPSSGVFRDPLAFNSTPGVDSTRNWCLYAEYITYTIDTSDIGSAILTFFDEGSDSLGSINFPSLTSRYLTRGFGLGPANLFQVEITSSSPGTIIEKLDIYYKVLGRKITQ